MFYYLNEHKHFYVNITIPCTALFTRTLWWPYLQGRILLGSLRQQTILPSWYPLS